MVNNKIKIVFFSFLLCLFFSIGMPVCAAEGQQVFDQARLLSADEVQDLETKTDELRTKYKMNFVVVTTSNTNGKETRDYADDFYMENGFYGNDEKGGIALVIDMDNREIYVSTAGDMVYYITDPRVESLLDEGYTLVGNEEYYQCFDRMLDGTKHFLEQGIVSN